MRAAVKYLAPLILLPFLACTDTPAEPAAEEKSALFSSDQPHEPGDWLVANTTCYGGKYRGILMAVEHETGLIVVDCWPSWLNNDVSFNCGISPAYAPTADSEVFRVFFGVGGRTDTGPGGGTSEWLCLDESDVSVAELPYTRSCFAPHGDGLRLACESQFYRVTID